MRNTAPTTKKFVIRNFNKVICFLLLLFVSFFSLSACGTPTAGKNVETLSLQNYAEFLNIALQIEDYQTSKEVINQYSTQYTTSATIRVSISKSNIYNFRNCSISFSLNISPFSPANTELIISSLEKWTILVDFDGRGQITIPIMDSNYSSFTPVHAINNSSITVKSVSGFLVSI